MKTPQIKRFILVCVGLISFGSLPAQAPLTLGDAVQYALKNSEVLRQAGLDIEKGYQQVKETRGAALPQINVTSAVNNNVLVMQMPLPAEFLGGEPGKFIALKAGQPWSANTQVTLSQQLYNKQVFTGLKAAKSTEDFYRISQDLTKEDLLQQVAMNYYQVQISGLQMAVIDANLERVKRLEEMITGQFNNGLAKKIDVDRVKVNKSNLDAQKLLLENGLKQQLNALKYYMGMPVEEQIELARLDPATMQVAPELSASAGQFGVDNLLSFRVLKKQEELLTLQREATRSEGFPTLSLNGNYTYNTQNSRLNLYTGKALNYDMATITLNLRIPIFDGFTRRAKVQQNSIAIKSLQEDIRRTTNALNMNNENARTKLSNSLRTIEVQRANKDLAQEVFDNVQSNYRNGLASLTDLLDAESGLVESQRSLNEAMLQYKIGEIELLKANGQINTLLDL